LIPTRDLTTTHPTPAIRVAKRPWAGLPADRRHAGTALGRLAAVNPRDFATRPTRQSEVEENQALSAERLAAVVSLRPAARTQNAQPQNRRPAQPVSHNPLKYLRIGRGGRSGRKISPRRGGKAQTGEGGGA
jgi:hypothetical protein